MIAAPVQGDVDGIPKGSHYVRVPPVVQRGNLCPHLSRERRTRYSLSTPAARRLRQWDQDVAGVSLTLLPRHQVPLERDGVRSAAGTCDRNRRLETEAAHAGEHEIPPDPLPRHRPVAG